MPTGYRNVIRDRPAFVGDFHDRTVTDYLGRWDSVVTEPNGSYSDDGGMWVTKNLYQAAGECMFCMVDYNAGIPRISLVAVTWDDADVLETKDTGRAIQDGAGRPDPAVSYVGYRVSALTTGDEFTYAEIVAAANDITQQEA